MNKSVCLAICLCTLFMYCGPKQEVVEKIIEDGVEVVLNHFEPYEIGEEVFLSLEQQFTLDFERADLAELGIGNILGFDVDSLGYIYVWCDDTSDNFIYRFDKDGNFVNSFGRKGQGPGELERPRNLRINNEDEVIVSDARRGKIVKYNTGGDLLREVGLDDRTALATQLSNSNLLYVKGNFNPDTGYTQLPVLLSQAESDNAVELQKGQKMPNWIRAPEINGFDTVSKPRNYSISGQSIFIDNPENGYEFLIYNLDGQLHKKIRKEFELVPISQEFKDAILSMFVSPLLQEYKVAEKVFFPENMPPFQYYFTDDKSRLYVMTCEKGQDPNEYMYDIFNSDGYFISRISLDNFGNTIKSVAPLPLPATAKNNRLYYLRGKESGYYELSVSLMIWQ